MTRAATRILCLILAFPVYAEDRETRLERHPNEKVHLFLLAGQSNMAGRGLVAAEDKMVHPQVYALTREGVWAPAIDPIHWDKRVAGVGLGKSFAAALAERDEDVIIGLVPAACGGSPISSWEPGGYHNQTDSHPYDDAIERMRRALRDGVLKGVLWHQGESDSNADRAGLYKERLMQLISRFRHELDAEETPFIIGQLGRFEERPWDAFKEQVNQAHISIAEELPGVGFVSSQGLSPKSDNVHFDAASLKELGRRYAEVFLKTTERGSDGSAN